MSEGAFVPLGEIADLKSGGTPSKSRDDYWNGQIPWISGKTLHDTFVRDSDLYVTEAGLSAGSNLAPVNASLILVRGMSLLQEIRIGLAVRPVAFNQDVKAIVARSEVLPRYLNLALRAAAPTLLGQVHQAGHGTGVLATDRLTELPIWLPPPDEQERIAGVLGAFDDLIETNRETVYRLDRLGKIVVQAYASAKRPTITATLAAACEVIESGRRPKGGVKGIAFGVPSLGAESVNGLTEFEFAKTKFVPTEFANQMRRGVLADLDVLVYKDGGKPGEFFPDVSIVGNGYPFDRMVINEHVFRVRGSEALGQGYLYFWLTTDKMMGLMKETGSRTAAIPGMNSTNFGQLPVVVPDAEWRSAHMGALDQLIVCSLSLLAASRDLAKRRNDLLPLLMSGQVRVRDVEAVVS